MEKKTVKAVTRKQKYLAAIAGDGVAPSPITSDEKLMYNIAEKMNEGGGSGGSGGGIIAVNAEITLDSSGFVTKCTLDKTFDEIQGADFAIVKKLASGTLEYGYILVCTSSSVIVEGLHLTTNAHDVFSKNGDGYPEWTD